MKRLKVYLDTSVISHLDAVDTPEKMEDTKRLWERIRAGAYDASLSTVTLGELDQCAPGKRAILLDWLSRIEYDTITVNAEIERVAVKFVDMGVLRQKSLDDCLHIAAAIVSNCDIIVSWNFKHIVNRRTIDGVKVVATLTAYKEIGIYTPTMLVEGDDDDKTGY